MVLRPCSAAVGGYLGGEFSDRLFFAGLVTLLDEAPSPTPKMMLIVGATSFICGSLIGIALGRFQQDDTPLIVGVGVIAAGSLLGLRARVRITDGFVGYGGVVRHVSRWKV